MKTKMGPHQPLTHSFFFASPELKPKSHEKIVNELYYYYYIPIFP